MEFSKKTTKGISVIALMCILMTLIALYAIPLREAIGMLGVMLLGLVVFAGCFAGLVIVMRKD